MTLPLRQPGGETDQPNPSEQAKAAAARALEPTGPEFPNEITQSPLHSKVLETRARDLGQPEGRHGPHGSDGAESRRPRRGVKAQQELPYGDDASLLQGTCDDSELASLLQGTSDLGSLLQGTCDDSELASLLQGTSDLGSLLQGTCDDSELASLLQAIPDLGAAGYGQDTFAALLTELPVERLVWPSDDETSDERTLPAPRRAQSARVRPAAKPERLHRSTVAASRDGLQRVLEAIRAGELTAGPGYVARLEGAIAALGALMEKTEPSATRPG